MKNWKCSMLDGLYYSLESRPDFMCIALLDFKVIAVEISSISTFSLSSNELPCFGLLIECGYICNDGLLFVSSSLSSLDFSFFFSLLSIVWILDIGTLIEVFRLTRWLKVASSAMTVSSSSFFFFFHLYQILLLLLGFLLFVSAFRFHHFFLINCIIWTLTYWLIKVDAPFFCCSLTLKFRRLFTPAIWFVSYP